MEWIIKACMRASYIFILLFFSAFTCPAQEPIFFPEDIRSRNAIIPTSFTVTDKPAQAPTVRVEVDASDIRSAISDHLFGNNANVYMTQMVDQPVLLEHIRKLAPGLIRFPGGNLSSVFFWDAEPGNPPADAPLKLVDANGQEVDPNYWYGKNSESWTLSLDNFYAMLESTNSTAILTVNYGYARYSTAADPVAAAAHLAAEWVRYDDGRTKFWEIGNESNGTWQAGYRIDVSDNNDGQPELVTGALYGKHFKVFADSMRHAAAEKGHEIFIGAQLLAEPPASWSTAADKSWNEGVLGEAGSDPDFYVIHSYYTPYQTNSSALDILNSAASVTEDMKEYVTSAVSSAGLPAKPLAMTEWNIFAEGSKQQVSFISGMHAAIVIGELMRNQYAIACRWDLANGWNNGNDHGLFSQGDQPGVAKWHPRPAYYYLLFSQKYMGDQVLHSSSDHGDVLAYASKYSSGEVGLTIVNKSKADHIVGINLDNFGFGERFYFHSLTGGSDNGEFSLKVFVNGSGPTADSGGPPAPEAVKPRASSISGGVKVHSPGRSVQFLLIEDGDNIITGARKDTDTDLHVYPNPGREVINLKLPSPGFSSWEIRNFQGVRLFRGDIGSAAHSVEVRNDLAPGLYYLILLKDGVTYQKRIIIY